MELEREITKLSFMDLFSGIGGFRMGFERQGYRCVFSCEKDAHAQKMYAANFGERPFGDINDIDIGTIPDTDVLLAGFPCQPFSAAGHRQGFDDGRGTLFFRIVDIAKEKMPRLVVIENVKALVTHNGGQSLATVVDAFATLGYTVTWSVLNASNFGVPQSRERVIIAASLGQPLDLARLRRRSPVAMKGVLQKEGDFNYLDESDYTLIERPKSQPSGLIFAGYRHGATRKRGVRPGTLHLSRTHRQPNRIYSSEGVHPTLSSQEPTGRYFIFHDGRVRKLTLRECFRLMGFPDEFRLVGPKSKIYNRIGNSIVVPMVEEIASLAKESFYENYLY